MKILTRMNRLGLYNFRGFADHRELDLDADILVLAGPNGHGKTSLIDALNLLLNGWTPHSTKDLPRLRAKDASLHLKTDVGELTWSHADGKAVLQSLPSPLEAAADRSVPPAIPATPRPPGCCGSPSTRYRPSSPRPAPAATSGWVPISWRTSSGTPWAPW